MSTTATATQWWQQHVERKGQPWCEYYWEDWKAPHRQSILLALSLLPPVASLHEIGCNSGPNLRLIQATFPHIKLSGSEFAPIAGQMARERLGVPIDIGTLPESLETAPSADVYLSVYTLAYLDPEDAHVTLLRLNRLAKTLILMEPMALAGLPLGQCRDDGLPEWRHDYEQTLGALGWRTAWKWPLIPPVQNLNALLVMQRRR